MSALLFNHRFEKATLIAPQTRENSTLFHLSADQPFPFARNKLVSLQCNFRVYSVFHEVENDGDNEKHINVSSKRGIKTWKRSYTIPADAFFNFSSFPTFQPNQIIQIIMLNNCIFRQYILIFKINFYIHDNIFQSYNLSFIRERKL